MKVLKFLLQVQVYFFLMLVTQNCSNPAGFNDIASEGVNPFEEPDPPVGAVDTDQDDTPIIVDFNDPTTGTPFVPGGGLIGKIYYLLNDSGSEEMPSTVSDKNGVDIPFPEGVNAVDVVLERGYQLPAKIVMTNMFIPTSSFLSGFQDSKGNQIKDVLGNDLIEAFGLDVKGTLELRSDWDPGVYEFALLADDGAILNADLDGNGSFEATLVNNDGAHSTQMGCSSHVVTLNYGDKLPLQVKYYQGPREHIALTLMMRRLGPGESPVQDAYCGFSSNQYWFNFVEGPDYVPDLVSSKFGELLGRGWQLPSSTMFRN